MLRKLFPHPYLSVALVITWMLLVNGTKLGSLVFAIILAIIVPRVTAAYWPDRAVVRAPVALLAYIGLVIWDIIIANIAVAKIVLFMRNEDIKPAWICVPHDLTSAEAITVLAGTITLTPGTLVADVSKCQKYLLVHALHAPDPDAVRDDIKARYESRLKRIFT